MWQSLALKLLPWAIGAISLIGIIWQIDDWRSDANKLPEVERRLSDYQEAVHNANIKSAMLENKLSVQRQYYEQLNNEAKDEVKKPDYVCKHPASTNILLNRAVNSRSLSR